MKRLESLYQDGKPLHMASPNDSMIETLTHEEFEALPTDEAQTLLKRKIVIVHGVPSEDIKFNKAGMRTLVNSMRSRIFIQGKCCQNRSSQMTHNAIQIIR